MNTNIYKNNKSGVRGVSFEARSQKYRAYIQIENKRTYLGYFQTKEEAIAARVDAEQFNQFFNKEIYDTRYPLIAFVLENKVGVKTKTVEDAAIYDKLYKNALGELIRIISEYPGNEVFITYAIRELTKTFNDYTYSKALSNEQAERIADIYLNEIPDTKEKQYIELYLKGFTPSEIANELGICINTTYKYLKLSIKKLKEDFKI